MDKVVKNLIEEHRRNGNFRIDKSEIEAGLDWSYADLRGFELTEIIFSTNERRADFSHAILCGVNLQNSEFISATLIDTDFSGRNTDLKFTNFSNADLTETKFYGSNFKFSTLKNIISFGVKFIGTDLTNSNLSGADLDNADFRGATLENANLMDTHLENVKFQYANLYMTRFSGSKINLANFSPKDIHEIKEQEKSKIIETLRQDRIEESIIEIINNNIDLILQDEERFYKACRIYREFKNVYHQIGDGESESDLHYKEKNNFTKYLIHRKHYRGPIHWFFKILCGYGEKWYLTFIWMVGIILFFWLIFWAFSGVTSTSNFKSLGSFDYLYFSTGVFTTMGVSDLSPSNMSINLNISNLHLDIPIFRVATGIEALSGALLIATFVVVFTKRIFR